MRHLSLALAAMLAVSVTPSHAALNAPLNDTGQTLCYDASDAVADCATVAAEDGPLPRQDARFGRDPAFADGQFAKTGAGAAGFDFTRICMSGEAAGTGTCPADPPQPADPANPGNNEWACTRDNHTNLIWSIETIRGATWTAATTTLPDNYDIAKRCGFDSEWRAPTRRELLSIVHHGAINPAVDANFFPNTESWYWSSDAYAPGPADAWSVDFYDGYPAAVDKSNPDQVRLVRSGQ